MTRKRGKRRRLVFHGTSERRCQEMAGHPQGFIYLARRRDGTEMYRVEAAEMDDSPPVVIVFDLNRLIDLEREGRGRLLADIDDVQNMIHDPDSPFYGGRVGWDPYEVPWRLSLRKAGDDCVLRGLR